MDTFLNRICCLNLTGSVPVIYKHQQSCLLSHKSEQVIKHLSKYDGLEDALEQNIPHCEAHEAAGRGLQGE